MRRIDRPLLLRGSLRFRQAIAADAPALWWRLDETSGASYVDASGNGFTGTGSGTIVQDVAPVFGGSPRAIDVSGTGRVSRASGPNIVSAPFTFAVCVTLSDLSTDAYLMGYGLGPGVDDWGVALRIETTGKVGFLIVTTQGSDVLTNCATGTGVAAVGVPYLLHGTWEPGVGAKLYVNGVLAQTAAQALLNVRTIVTSYNAGQGINSTTRCGGKISDALVFLSTLSASQIAAHYAARDT